jgi:hypothetical protein
MCPVQAVLLPCFEYNVQLYSCTAGYLIYMYLSRPLARTVGSSTYIIQLLWKPSIGENRHTNVLPYNFGLRRQLRTC